MHAMPHNAGRTHLLGAADRMNSSPALPPSPPSDSLTLHRSVCLSVSPLVPGKASNGMEWSGAAIKQAGGYL